MKRARLKRIAGDLSSKKGIDRLAFEGSAYIAIVGTALVFLFAWLQLQDVPIVDAIENTNREYVQKFTLVIYYSCWVWGTSFDLRMQRLVYLRQPNETRYQRGSIAAVVSTLLVSATLLWVKDDEIRFAHALAVFLVVNVIAWRHFLSIVRPIIRVSKKDCVAAYDHLGFEQLRVVELYIGGR